MEGVGRDRVGGWHAHSRHRVGGKGVGVGEVRLGTPLHAHCHCPQPHLAIATAKDCLPLPHYHVVIPNVTGRRHTVRRRCGLPASYMLLTDLPRHAMPCYAMPAMSSICPETVTVFTCYATPRQFPHSEPEIGIIITAHEILNV